MAGRDVVLRHHCQGMAGPASTSSPGNSADGRYVLAGTLTCSGATCPFAAPTSLEAETSMSIQGALAPLFAPRSIAIIGASNDPTRIGGRPIAALRQGGFAGDIYPINPNRAEVQGVRAYPDVRDIPGGVDCAIVAVGADLAVPAIEACAARGVRSAVIFSAGFAEATAPGPARQARIVEVARAAGMRMIGPNCLGMFHTPSRTYLTFTALFQGQTPAGGHLGLVSQSGGSGAHILKLAQQRGLKLGTFVTTGNEADVEFGEVLTALADDDDVKVIVGYVEGVRSRDSFLQGLARAHAARKPVVLLKVGRTESGAAAAASHTASLAGADSIYDAVFHQYGVFRARNTEELLDVAYAAQHARLTPGRRLGVVTISGGMGAQIADAAGDAGLVLSPTPDVIKPALRKLCPPGSPENPVDVTAQVSTDHALLARSLDLVMESGAFDSYLVFFGLYAGVSVLCDRLLETLSRVRAARPDGTAAVCIVATPEMKAAYEKAGYLVFEEPARAVAALAALAAIAEGFGRKLPVPYKAGVARIAAGERFNEVQAKALLSASGLRIPAEIFATSASEAARNSGTQRGLLVLKIVSQDLAHKSDVGGVALRLQPGEIANAVEAMAAEVSRRAPRARIEGFLVAEMIGGGVEVIVGARRDPLFGPVILVGLGGVLVELFKDVSLRLAPVTPQVAREMIGELQALPLMTGYRGKAAVDIDACAEAVAAVSRFAADNAATLESVEVNPLMVLPDGAVALDAVIETVPVEGMPPHGARRRPDTPSGTEGDRRTHVCV
jgi:acetate---CoA ligase (ADP-forming)